MNRHKTFLAYIIDGFVSVFNIWASIISILLGILAFFAIPSDEAISLRWLIILTLVFLFLILLLLRIIRLIYIDTSKNMPKVKYASQEHSERGLLLLEPSKLFSYNSVVAIYYFERNLETLIGVGEVSNIQENGFIQICVEKKTDTAKELWEKIFNNDAGKICNLIVKPYVPRSSLRELYNE